MLEREEKLLKLQHLFDRFQFRLLFIYVLGKKPAVIKSAREFFTNKFLALYSDQYLWKIAIHMCT